MYNDSVSCYALIKRYRTKEYALSNSGWTLLDSAEQIFTLSKERVYNGQGGKCVTYVPQNMYFKRFIFQEFDPEHCPKWKFLSEILKVEIPADMKRTKPNSYDPPKVLILCQDSRTCYQLKQYLTQSGERYLLYTAMREQIPVGKLSKVFDKIQAGKELEMSVAQESQPTQRKFIKSEAKDLSEDGDATTNSSQLDELSQLLTQNDMEDHLQYYQESYMLTMTQTQFDESDLTLMNDSGTGAEDNVDNSIFEPFPEMENLDITAAVAAQKQPLICLQTFKTEREGSTVLDRVLEEINPQYVIMYHCNVTAIRQLEIYEARQRRPAKDRLKVFFLIHARTVEEQAYLTSLRREKQAYEYIIETKSVSSYLLRVTMKLVMHLYAYRKWSFPNTKMAKVMKLSIYTRHINILKIVLSQRMLKAEKLAVKFVNRRRKSQTQKLS